MELESLYTATRRITTAPESPESLKSHESPDLRRTIGVGSKRQLAMQVNQVVTGIFVY